MQLLTPVEVNYFKASWPRPTHDESSTLAMESRNVFNLQDFEQNEIPFKQKSFEDYIDTLLSLFDTDLLQ